MGGGFTTAPGGTAVMIRAELLATALVEDGTTETELRLYRRLLKQGPEYTIRIAGGTDLMSSRRHGSEDALGELACRGLSGKPGARVLIGGLGIGFTLASTLRHLGPDASVTVAELVSDVVDWNRTWLGECAGNPLDDPRASAVVGDVAELIERGDWDAIVLDVDNGPEALTTQSNAGLYSMAGLAKAAKALRERGVLLVWSSSSDGAFERRLRNAGFRVEVHRVRAHQRKGARHVIWVASPGGPVSSATRRRRKG